MPRKSGGSGHPDAYQLIPRNFDIDQAGLRLYQHRHPVQQCAGLHTEISWPATTATYITVTDGGERNHNPFPQCRELELLRHNSALSGELHRK